MKDIPKICPVCDSQDLFWSESLKQKGAVQDGRLRLTDVSAQFVLGCEYCSETITILEGDEILEALQIATSVANTSQDTGWRYSRAPDGQTALVVHAGRTKKMTFYNGEWQQLETCGVFCYNPDEITCWMPWPKAPTKGE